MPQSGLQIIRSKHIEAAGIGDDEEESEKYAKGAVVHGGFDVVGRPAVAVSLAVSSLIDLGKVLSINADAPPMTAITHIQKTEPGPPRQIAVETPRIFPVPTRDAVETMSA